MIWTNAFAVSPSALRLGNAPPEGNRAFPTKIMKPELRTRHATEIEALRATVSGFHARGWCLATSGNFSVVLERRPLQLLITQSGRDKGELGVEDFVIVGEDGRPVDGEGRPSAETLLHCAIAEWTPAGAILHTHSVAGTVLGEASVERSSLTLSGYEMIKGLEGVHSHLEQVEIPVLANAQDMVAFSGRVQDLLREQPALHGFLIAGHGLYTWGADLAQAKRHVEALEFLFECVVRRHQLTGSGDRMR